MLETFLILGVPLALGFAILSIAGIGLRMDLLGMLGWSWTIGAVGQGAFVFLWCLSGIGFEHVFLPVLGEMLLIFFVLRGTRPIKDREVVERAPRWSMRVFYCGLAVTFVVLIGRFLDASLEPAFTHDEAHHWVLRAKILWHTGGFGGEFFNEMQGHVQHKDYPWLNPLLQLWSFILHSDVSIVVNRLPIQAFAISQVLILASLLRRVIHPALAGLLLVIYISPGESIVATTLAQGDAMVGHGLLCAIAAWTRARLDAHAGWYRIAALCLAMMVVSKNEGILYLACGFAGIAAAWIVAVRRVPLGLVLGLGLCGALIAIRAWLASRLEGGGLADYLGLFAEPMVFASLAALAGLALTCVVDRSPLAMSLLPWLATPLLAAALHFGFNAYYDFASPVTQHGLLSRLFAQLDDNAGPLAEYFFGEYAANGVASAWMPYAVLALLVLRPASWWPSLLAPTIALLAAYLGIAATFVATPAGVDWHLTTAGVRVWFQLFPATLLWFALAASRAAPLLNRDAKLLGKLPAA